MKDINTKWILYHTCCCLLLCSLASAQTPLVHDQNSNDTETVSDKPVLADTGGILVPSSKEKSTGSIGNITLSNGDDDLMGHTGEAGIPKADIENQAQVKIRAVTVLHSPYVMKGPGSTLVGLVPDILKHMQARLGVSFHLHLVTDGQYGSLNGSSWTGMMGEVVKKMNGDDEGADMAAAPMEMTSDRQKYVDFLNPFIHGGLVGLVKKPHMDDRQGRFEVVQSYFSILGPLSSGVWFSLFIGCLAVALLLWFINLFNPYEWGGRYNLGRGTEAAAESFSLTGSLWFTFTTLQWQGFDRMPRSGAGKLLSTFWFVFVTLACIMYTASVVNHLLWASTLHGKDLTASPFIDLAHLVSAHDEYGYDFGMTWNGPVHKFVTGRLKKGGAKAEYAQMANYWQEHPEDIVIDTLQGVQRARQGKYVFLTERMNALFYVNQRPCDLMIIDKPIGVKSYGMAISKNLDKKLVDGMRAVILDLTLTGEIDMLERHWTRDMSQCWDEAKQEKQMSVLSYIMPTSPKQVTLSMFAAPVVALLVGIVLSVIVFFIEAIYYRYKGRYTRSNREGGHRLGAAEGEQDAD